MLLYSKSGGGRGSYERVTAPKTRAKAKGSRVNSRSTTQEHRSEACSHSLSIPKSRSRKKSGPWHIPKRTVTRNEKPVIGGSQNTRQLNRPLFYTETGIGSLMTEEKGPLLKGDKDVRMEREKCRTTILRE